MIDLHLETLPLCRCIVLGSDLLSIAVADPGFPVGGGGGHGPLTWALLVKMYAKMKELGPIGGACTGHTPPDLPMHCLTCQAHVHVH